MSISRQLIVVLLLALAAPIGLGGLVSPAYAQQGDGDSQEDHASDQGRAEHPASASDDPVPAKPQPDIDFSNLDVGEANELQHSMSTFRGGPGR